MNALTPVQQNANPPAWLFKKGVEDLVFAVKESVIAACSYLTLPEMVRSGQQFSAQDITELAAKMNAQLNDEAEWADGQSLFSLLEKIKKMCGTPVCFTAEILSINQVRNCLVHRGGVVGPKDVKRDAHALVLSYLDLVFYHEVDGIAKE